MQLIYIWQEVYHKFNSRVNNFLCSRLGHRVYWEDRINPNHYACRRGCGPVGENPWEK